MIGSDAIERTISSETMPPTTAPEHVRTRHRVRQLAAGFRGEPLDVGVRIALGDPFLGDDPVDVAHRDPVRLDAEGVIELCGRGRGRPRAGEDDVEFVEWLVGDLGGVEQRSPGDDGGAVLVVVKHRNVHLLAQPRLDLETLRRLYVLQVDPAERRLHRADGGDDVLGVVLVQLDVEDVDVGEAFEQDALSLHDGFRRLGADVTQPEDGAAVRDHPDHVALRRVCVGGFLVGGDLVAGGGHARRVRQREVPLGVGRLRRRDLDLPRRLDPVVLQRIFVQSHGRIPYSGVKKVPTDGKTTGQILPPSLPSEVGTRPRFREIYIDPVANMTYGYPPASARDDGHDSDDSARRRHHGDDRRRAHL